MQAELYRKTGLLDCGIPRRAIPNRGRRGKLCGAPRRDVAVFGGLDGGKPPVPRAAVFDQLVKDPCARSTGFPALPISAARWLWPTTAGGRRPRACPV